MQVTNAAYVDAEQGAGQRYQSNNVHNEVLLACLAPEKRMSCNELWRTETEGKTKAACSAAAFAGKEAKIDRGHDLAAVFFKEDPELYLPIVKTSTREITPDMPHRISGSGEDSFGNVGDHLMAEVRAGECRPEGGCVAGQEFEAGNCGLVGTAKGDSGGFIGFQATNFEHVLVGVTSRARTNAKCDERDNPGGVYSRVTPERVAALTGVTPPATDLATLLPDAVCQTLRGT